MGSAVQEPAPRQAIQPFPKGPLVPPPAAVGPEFFRQDMPLDQLRASPLNPRKHFDEARLRELADTFAGVGIIEPLVARSAGGHYEVICGERRLRAAAIAQLATVPVIVKSLTDAQALEIMVVENNQREDVGALEEAEGFRQLLATGYELEKLAERIGRSKKYVYDRLKLLELVPAAKKLLLDERITAGHAILLARLTPAEQALAIDPDQDGLFARSDDDARTDADPYAGLDVGTVRDFEQWIDRNIRIDLAKPVEPQLFPVLAEALLDTSRVVPITHAHYVDDENESADGDKVLTRGEWKRADGTTGLDQFAETVTFRECALSRLGVVVIGRERGSAFKVCVDKGCDIHWKKERAAARRAGQGAAGPSPAAKAKRDAENRKWKAQQEREVAERAAYRTRATKILSAFAIKVKAAKVGTVMAAVLEGLPLHPRAVAALGAMGKAKTPDDLLRVLVLSAVAADVFNGWTARQEAPKWAARFGLDLAPLLGLEKNSGVQTSAQPKTSPAKAKSKANKKR